MHLPDQFLSNQTSFVLTAISAGFLSSALKNFFQSNFEKVKIFQPIWQTDIGQRISSLNFSFKFQPKKEASKKIERLALVAAFIFAAQMLNFPVEHGTSGHFLGAVLALMVLGPWSGLLALSVVLAVQALVFSDGGIIALGANIFNMGVVGIGVGYFIYHLIFSRWGKKNLALAVASWFSVVAASLACALELAFSGTISFSLVIPAMFKVHALIGVGEVIITILALKYIFYEPAK